MSALVSPGSRPRSTSVTSRPLVLEAEGRVGGRILSKQRGDLALSVGAHMFPPPDSVVGRAVSEFGLEVMPITGSMLNVYLRGKLIRDTRPEFLPFRLPLSIGGGSLSPEPDYVSSAMPTSTCG